MHTHIHAHIPTCRRAYMHTHTYIHISTEHTYTYTYKHPYTYTYKHIHTYIHTTADLKRSSGLLTWKVRDQTNKDNQHTHTYTHEYTHTYTRQPISSAAQACSHGKYAIKQTRTTGSAATKTCQRIRKRTISPRFGPLRTLRSCTVRKMHP